MGKRPVACLKNLIVAHYTIKDCLNRNFICLVLLFLLSSYGLGYLLARYTIGSPLKIVLDICLLPYQLFCVYFILFYTIPFPTRHKTYAIPDFFLLHTLTKKQFFIGTFFGMLFLLIMAGTFLYGCSLILFTYFSDLTTVNLLPCFLMTTLETIFLLTLSLFFSLFLSQEFVYIVVISVYMISYLNNSWLSFVEKKLSGIPYALGLIMYHLIPDATLINIHPLIVYNLPLDISRFTVQVVYLISFIVLFLSLSGIIITKKKYYFL